MSSGITVEFEEHMKYVDLAHALGEENAKLRETNKRLNRRVQLAESAALQTVEACKRQGVPLSRQLAAFRFEDVKRKIMEVLA